MRSPGFSCHFPATSSLQLSSARDKRCFLPPRCFLPHMLPQHPPLHLETHLGSAQQIHCFQLYSSSLCLH